MFRKYSAGLFVKDGSTNVRHSNLIDHNKSAGHVLADKHLQNSRNVAESEAAGALKKMNEAAFDKYTKLFRNAHAIAKHNRPFSDFEWLAKLDAMKGVYLGETYINDVACSKFIGAICDVEMAKISAILNESKFLTIISDGSTDVSTKENEAIYVRTAQLGLAKTYFVSFQEVPKADAQGIFRAISCAMDQVGVDVSQKIVCFTADGASVNTGEVAGVISQMRDTWNPSIVMVKCLMHRVELALKEAFKENATYGALQRLLCGVFKTYHKSPLMRAGLVESFKALDLSPIMPARVGGTRFVAHTLTALEKFWKAYRAIILHLSQVRH